MNQRCIISLPWRATAPAGQDPSGRGASPRRLPWTQTRWLCQRVAFRDAELCVTALDESFSGRQSFDEAMGRYQFSRDAKVLPMYELTAEFASLEPPPPELAQLLEAMAGNQEAMDGFARVNSGVTSPEEFFSADNVERIVDQAQTRRAS